MFALESYTNEELLKILSCNKLNALYDLLDEHKASYLYHSIQNKPPLKPLPNKTFQALLSPITDASTYPFLLLWSLIGVAAIAAFPLIICATVMTAISLGIGAVFFYSNYKDIKKKEIKYNRLLWFNTLQKQAADLLLNRQGISLEPLAHPEYPNTKTLSHFVEALRIGMLITYSLFGTYFLGLFALFSGIVLASIGIASLCVAVGVGIYFGYKHYQTLEQDKHAKFNQRCHMAMIDKKMKLYEEFQENGCDLLQEEKIHTSRPIYSSNNSTLRNKFSFKIRKINPCFFQPQEMDPVQEETLNLNCKLAS